MPQTTPVKPVPQQTHQHLELKHDSPFLSCRFDPTGEYVFAGAQDNRVWRWRVADQEKVALAAHDSWCRGIAFLTQPEPQVLTGGYDGRLIWWSTTAETPQPLRTLQAHDGWLRTVAVNADQTLVATAGNDLIVRVWNASSGELQQELPGHEAHVYNLAFHPQETHRLVSGDLKAQFTDWNVAEGTKVREFKIEPLHKYDGGFRADIGGPRSMAFDASGQRLACSGITNVTNAFAGVGNPLVVEVNWAEAKEIVQHAVKDKFNGVGWGVTIHPEGFVIAACGGSGGGHLVFWQPDGKEEFHKLKLPNTARDLSLHPNGLDLAVAHYDSRIRIYRMAEKPAG